MLHKLKLYLDNLLAPKTTEPATWVIHLVWPLSLAYLVFVVLGSNTDLATQAVMMVGFVCAPFVWWWLAKKVSRALPPAVPRGGRDLLAIVLTAPLYWITGQLISLGFFLLLVVVPCICLYLLFGRTKSKHAHVIAGQVWWAEVPFEEEGMSKDRPIVVVSVGSGAVAAFYVTSQNKDDRRGFTRLQAALDDRQSWVEIGRTRTIPLDDLRRPQGALPAHEFRRLCDLHTMAVSG